MKSTEDENGEEVTKSLDIIIPINERGNSSSILRMIHRQWYNKVQYILGQSKYTEVV